MSERTKITWQVGGKELPFIESRPDDPDFDELLAVIRRVVDIDSLSSHQEWRANVLLASVTRKDQ